MHHRVRQKEGRPVIDGNRNHTAIVWEFAGRRMRKQAYKPDVQAKDHPNIFACACMPYHFRMEFFRDKTILITGASSGIGPATAVRLAQYGARIGLAARNRASLEEARGEIERAGGAALVLPTDVTAADQVRDAVEATVARFGKLDILLASAGLSMRAYFEGSQLDAMERVMRVNFFGTLYATHFALPHVKKTHGSLVAISSLTGKRGIPSYAIYGASKFAIQGLYESLRLELMARRRSRRRSFAGFRRHAAATSTCWGRTASRGRIRRRRRFASGPSKNASIAS